MYVLSLFTFFNIYKSSLRHQLRWNLWLIDKQPDQIRVNLTWVKKKNVRNNEALTKQELQFA